MLVRIAIVFGVLLGALGYWWLSRLWIRWLWRRRRSRGRQGELDAEVLLIDHGYTILEDQASRDVTVQVDGQSHPYRLRPDYLVKKKGRRYVAEVKTGKKAPNPLYTSTRRQLLEYEVCFPEHGLLLVDMEASRVHEVSWRELRSAPRPGLSAFQAWWLLAGAFALGLVAGILATSI